MISESEQWTMFYSFFNRFSFFTFNKFLVQRLGYWHLLGINYHITLISIISSKFWLYASYLISIGFLHLQLIIIWELFFLFSFTDIVENIYFSPYKCECINQLVMLSTVCRFIRAFFPLHIQQYTFGIEITYGKQRITEKAKKLWKISVTAHMYSVIRNISFHYRNGMDPEVNSTK